MLSVLPITVHVPYELLSIFLLGMVVVGVPTCVFITADILTLLIPLIEVDKEVDRLFDGPTMVGAPLIGKSVHVKLALFVVEGNDAAVPNAVGSTS